MDDQTEHYMATLDITNVLGKTVEQKRKILEQVKEEILRKLVRSFGYSIWINDDRLMVFGSSQPMVGGLVREAKERIGGIGTVATVVSKDACFF